MNPSATLGPRPDRLQRLEERLDRERRARVEAERLLETKSLELYEANRALSSLATDLERRVEDRTRELTVARQQAVAQAELDALTGIANRKSFGRQLDEALALPKSADEMIAVVLIDLDDFKTVNDTLGHAAGDALLIEFARRLIDTVRPGDVVARLGGDEFAIIAREVGNRQGALMIAHRALRTLQKPVSIGDRSVPCSCSVGVAETARPGTDADELLRDADLALYASKRAGRARVTPFEGRLRADADARAALDAIIRQAVFDDRIEPWYQPIFSAVEGRCVGVEVLARWHVDGQEVRGPDRFLAAVEALGLLDTMMEKMLTRALRETAPMVAGGSLDYVSINVSPSQFNQGWALNRLPTLLSETGFPDNALVVEITETALLADIDRTREMLEALTGSGMRIALDDFGVGYSNFSLLRQLPFDILKLDQSLIVDIESDPHARALAEGILDLAGRLRIPVVAEGVETAGQAAMLTSARCFALQGYWFARPQRALPIDARLRRASALRLPGRTRD